MALVSTFTSPADRVIFLPKTGTEFVTLEFVGGSCAIAGEKPVKGSVTVGASTGQTENTLQPIEGLGSKENNSLTIGGHPTFLEGGKALLKLASGSKWSFH